VAEKIEAETSILTKLFAHNRWANLKLLDFCEGLSDEQLDTVGIGGFGSIRSTLLHIIGGEVSYINRVNGKLPPKGFGGEFFDFDALKEVARWTSDELLLLARAVREDTLVREHENQFYCEYTLASLIVQAINHANEHRAQIAAIITQLGMEPPEMDGWMFMRETGEFREWEEA
jgi:uncharacterized damage-inducible protein DinB